MTTLKLTEAIRARLAILRYAASYVGDDGLEYERLFPRRYDLLKLEFADEVLDAIRDQAAARRLRLKSLAALPRPAPAAVVEVRLTRKKKRA